MERQMRIKNAIVNTAAGGLGTLLAGFLQFVSRIVFIQFLSDEYLGISSLFTNILSILSLAELGIGTTIGFSLYEPLSEGSTEKIKSIMHLLKRIYFFIGFVIVAAGLCLIPFLPRLIKGSVDLVNLNAIYILYILQSATSYWFWAYKSILLQSDQKFYLIKFYQVISNVFITTIQLVTLAIFRNFLLYSAIGLLSNVLTNIMVSITVDKLYPYIRDTDIKVISAGEKKILLKDVFGMSLFKINTTLMSSIDNILISAFIHVRTVALYGNYQTVISGISQVVMQVFGGVTATIGNLIVEDSRERNEFIFRCIQLMCYWAYSFIGISILIFINPVIRLFFGKDRLFSDDLVFLQVLYFMLCGFQRTSFIYRDACGLFWKGKMRPVMTAVLNIIISVVLVTRIGLAGVILGTILSWIFTTWWYDPILIYRNVFRMSFTQYFLQYGKAVLVTLGAGIIAVLLMRIIPLDGIPNLVVHGLIAVLVPNGAYFIFYHRTPEFGYLKGIFQQEWKKIAARCQK